MIYANAPQVSANYNYNWLVPMSMLSENYSKGVGFGQTYYTGYDATSSYVYGKKSADGKTIYWYSGEKGATEILQFNRKNYTYSYLAIG